MPTRRPQFADTAEEIRSFDHAPFVRFDPTLIIADPSFQSLIDQVQERHLPSQKREAVRRNLTALLSNLYWCWWGDTDAFLAILASNSAPAFKKKIGGEVNRYNVASLSSTMVTVINSLAAAGVIDKRRGGPHPDTQQRVLSRIRADLPLIEMFEAQPQSVCQSVTIHPAAEFIILRDEAKNDIGYIDTPDTIAMRQRLMAYNLLLDRTFIDIPDLGDPPVVVSENTVRRARRKDGRPVDQFRRVTISQSRKRIVRIFSNGSWNQGGRFWHGFWMDLRAEDRRRLHINGNPTVELDYTGLHPVLLYAEAGIDYWSTTDSDPYELVEVVDPVTGTLVSRDIVKAFVLVMLNAKNKLSGFRAVRNNLAGQTGKVRLSDKLLDRMVERLVAVHPPFTDKLGSGSGDRLMNLDGRITDHIIDKLTRSGIPVLSIHDSYIVEEQNQDLLRQTMVDAFRAVTGMTTVRIKKEDRLLIDPQPSPAYQRRYERFNERLGQLAGGTGTDFSSALLS
jgi:hypothetical protein